MVYNIYMRKNCSVFIAIIAIVMFFVSSFSFATVFAEGAILDEDQLGAISQNCATIKQSLRALQRTDARTRAYLGSAYERVLSDFITPMDLRLINVNQPNASLTTIHSDIIESRQNFVRDYTVYSQKLEELITHDCQNDPQNFYHTLTDTREKRATLEKSTEKIRRLLGDHLAAVKKLEKNTGGENAD